MVKQVIIFIAPPGAGKGTQAELVCKKIGCVHLETSSVIEEKFKNTDTNDGDLNEARRQFLAGELVDPLRVVGWFLEKVKQLAVESKALAFSGSPRTLYEAEKVIPELERLYGRENIKIFNIILSEEESIKRNSGRRICQKNRHPIPGFPQYLDLVTCPEDGSPIVKRELDKPEIIKERYRVYKAETEPVLGYLKGRGYKVTEINGEQPIGKVSEDIMKYLTDE